MRKIFCIFLMLTALLSFIFDVVATDIKSCELWIRQNTTEILITRDDIFLSEGETITHFKNIQEQFGVYMLQAIWRDNERSISIYTTDTALDGKVSLSVGVFPLQLSDGFLSNKQTPDVSQAGRFHYFTTQDREVLIFPIEALAEQAGLGGIFYLNTIEDDTVADIISYLEESVRGSVQIRGKYGELSRRTIFTFTATENFPLTALFGTVCILFAFIAIRYILSLNKHSALMVIEGYSKKRIAFECLLGILPIFLLSFTLISAYILAYLAINDSIYFWWMFVRDNIAFHVAVLALFALTAFCLISLQATGNKAVKVLTGNRQNVALTVMHFFVKYTVLIAIVIASLQAQTQVAYLRERQQADLYWHQSENVYRTIMRVAVDFENLASTRLLEIRSKQLFNELSEELELFLINAYNFQRMNDGRYLWEWNSTDEHEGIYSLNGRTIIINENYLHRHPVYAANGTLAKEHIVYDPLIQNILVPKSLAPYEADIYQNFLHSFYFTKVDVANIYNRELGQLFDDTPIEQLSINIIFIEEGAQYFTYNPAYAATTHNVIKDPVVVVDTLNLDESYYYAWLTNSSFFESSSTNPLEELRPHVVRNNMGTALNKIDSVYDLHTDSIRKTEETLRILLLVAVALLLMFIFSIYTFIASYYEQHKYTIYVKRIFGYSNIRCNWHIFVFGTILTALVLLIFSVAWYIVVALIAIDILLITLFSKSIGNKSFSEIIKGVH